MLIKTFTPFILWVLPFLFLAATLVKPVRHVLAPTLQNENIYTHTLARAILSILALCMPFAFDLSVPEVAADLRWYIMHTSAAILLGIMCVHQCLTNKSFGFKKPSISLHVACYAAGVIAVIALLTQFWSISAALSMFTLQHLLSSIILFYAVIYFRHEQWFKTLLWLGAIGVAFNGFLGILQFNAVTDKNIANILPFYSQLPIMGIMEFFKQSAPPAGTLANKNLAASYMVISLPITLALILISKRISTQICASICFTLGSVFLVYTRTRGSWISATIALLFLAIWLFILYRKNVKFKNIFSRSKAALITLSLIIIVACSHKQSALNRYSVENSVSEQARSIFSKASNDLSARMAYNYNGLGIIADNPLGTGLATFHSIYPKYNNVVTDTPAYGYNLTARPRRAHNDLLQSFIELGVIGGMAYIVLFFSCLVMAWKMSTSTNTNSQTKILSTALITGIVGMGINLLGDFPLQMPMGKYVLWTFAGILTGLYMLNMPKGSFKKRTLPIPLPTKAIAILLALCAFSAAVWVTQDNYTRRHAQTFLKGAMSLSYTGQNNDFAAYFIDRAHNIYPMTSRTLEMRAVIYSGHGNVPPHKIPLEPIHKIEAIAQHLEHDPYAQNSLVNMVYQSLKHAQSLARSGNRSHAAAFVHYAHKHALRAVKITSKGAHAYGALGMTLYAQGNVDDALNAYNKALSYDPNDTLALRGKQQTIARLNAMYAR